jgi:hypothetical protein
MRDGGAHPHYYFRSYVFSPQSGREWKLPDYFRPGTPWLQKLSQSCIATLNKELPDVKEMVAVGASAKLENFQMVVPTTKGFRVYFPPYAVSSYADGIRKVTVPYSVFKDMFAAEAPLKAYR